MTFDVAVGECSCDASQDMMIDGATQADNGDISTANNLDSQTYSIKGEECSTCDTHTLTVASPTSSVSTTSSTYLIE